jgi:ABC-2 type transport system ATP-binding protein
MLKLNGLSKSYGDQHAVSSLSIEVPSGEIWGFLGVKPTSGSITLSGVDVVSEPVRAKAMMGYVPDRPYLYERLSAAEYLYFVAELYSIPPDRR